MRKKTGVGEFIRALLKVLAAVFAAYLLARFAIAKTVVDGVSMYPTLNDGENVVIDKLSYRIGEPKRFDIIVFEEEISDTGYFIKRIIGLPGEEVTIDKRGNVYINGKVLRDSHGYGVIADPGMAVEGVMVGEAEYFVLGDNRNNSADSRMRDVGNVSRDDVLGRVVLRIWPLEKFGFIDLYMDRKGTP